MRWVYRNKNTQESRVFSECYKGYKTMLMLSMETGVKRSNICRFIAKWRRLGLVRFVGKDYCVVSSHKAGYYTTNMKLLTTNQKRFKTSKS